MPDPEEIKIHELDQAPSIDKENDYLVISKESSAYTSGYKSFKATPDQLLAAAGVSTLASLTDVTIASPTTGEALLYSGGQWVNGEIPTPVSNLSELGDVDITSVSDGQVLKYDSATSKWINGTGGGGGASAMSDLTDVDLTNLSEGSSLVYDDTDDEWKAQVITKEVTQAQYDALVQAGTVDPKTVYFIKDTNGDGSQFQPIIYSLEEREIGVWTDGKPLYEKTIYSAGGVSGNFDIAHNISNLESVVAYSGLVSDTNYSQYGNIWTIPRIASDNNNIGINWVTTTDVNVMNPTAFGTRLIDWYITIQYTKSTDTAGSGTWTPQGVPTHKYSEDEQVVGTWVDGSTLYEKTIITDNPTAGTTSINHDITNLGLIVNIEGSAIRSNSAVQPLGFISSANSYGWNVTVYDFGSTAFTLEVGSQLTLSKVIVTVRYTKSSS